MERWQLKEIMDFKQLPYTLDFMVSDVIEWIWESPEKSDIRRIAGAIEEQAYESTFYPFCRCHTGKSNLSHY